LRAPATKFAPPISRLGGAHFFAAAVAINVRVSRTILAVHRMLELSKPLVSGTKWSEFLPCGYAITGTGAVLVLPVWRDWNFWIIARDTCCAAKTPSKSGFRA